MQTPSPWPQSKPQPHPQWLWPWSYVKSVIPGQFCTLAMFFSLHILISGANCSSPVSASPNLSLPSQPIDMRSLIFSFFRAPHMFFFSSQPIDMRSLISATAPLICFFFSPEALVHWWVLSSLLSSLESPPWLFSITGAFTHFYLSTVKTKGRALSEKISKLWIFTNGGFPFWKLLLY